MAGLHICANLNGRQIFVTGHAEYDRDTLAKEYFRDINKGLDPKVPYNYFPDDDDTKTPPFTWRSKRPPAGGQLAELLRLPADALRFSSVRRPEQNEVRRRIVRSGWDLVGRHGAHCQKLGHSPGGRTRRDHAPTVQELEKVMGMTAEDLTATPVPQAQFGAADGTVRQVLPGGVRLPDRARRRPL